MKNFIFSTLILLFVFSCNSKPQEPEQEQIVEDKYLPNLYIKIYEKSIKKNNFQFATMIIVSENDTIFVDSLKIKGRGNSSYNLPKKSYTIKLNKKLNFKDFPQGKSFAISGSYSDKSLIRNGLTYFITDEILDKTIAPKCCYINLYINKKYKGIFLLSKTPKQIFKKQKDAKILIEADFRKDDKYFFTSKKGINFCIKSKTNKQESKAIFDKIQKIEDMIFDNENFLQYIDIESFTDWYLVQEISKNPDGNFRTSCFMYFKESDKKLYFGPVWDFDLAWGLICKDKLNCPEGCFAKHCMWINKMLQNPDLHNFVQNRYNQIKNQIVPKSFFYIDSIHHYLSNDIDKNFEKYPILDQKIWPNTENPDYQLEDNLYSTKLENLKNWIIKRTEYLNFDD